VLFPDRLSCSCHSVRYLSFQQLQYIFLRSLYPRCGSIVTYPDPYDLQDPTTPKAMLQATRAHTSAAHFIWPYKNNISYPLFRIWDISCAYCIIMYFIWQLDSLLCDDATIKFSIIPSQHGYTEVSCSPSSNGLRFEGI
jgi:hypothetical protein